MHSGGERGAPLCRLPDDLSFCLTFGFFACVFSARYFAFLLVIAVTLEYKLDLSLAYEFSAGSNMVKMRAAGKLMTQ